MFRIIQQCLLLVVVVAVAFCGQGCDHIEKNKSNRVKLLVLAIDGMEPSLVDDYTRQGVMPNLLKIIDNGSSHPVQVEYSLISPLIWTSIATGVGPELHGVVDFTINGKPVDSSTRKVPAFWNILARNQVKSETVGWWATWPAKNDGGIMVGDRVHWPERPNKVYPEHIVDTSKYTIDNYLDGYKFLSRFTQFPYESNYKQKLAEGGEDYLTNQNIDKWLINIFCRDSINVDIANEIAKKEKPEVLSIYLQGIDHVSHAFWKYMEPEPFRKEGFAVSEEHATLLGKIIPEYYKYMDEMIGKLLQLCDKDTYIIVMSDHGFGSDPAVIKDTPQLGLSGNHRKKAVFIIAGPSVAKGTAELGLNVSPRQIDFLPTMLYLLGLPIAKDLPGRPLVEYFTKDFQDAKKINYIASYLDNDPLKMSKILPANQEKLQDDKKVLNELRGLGYVK